MSYFHAKSMIPHTENGGEATRRAKQGKSSAESVSTVANLARTVMLQKIVTNYLMSFKIWSSWGVGIFFQNYRMYVCF